MREQLGVAPVRDKDTVTVEWVRDQFHPVVITILSASVPAFEIANPHTCLDIIALDEDITSMTAGMTGTPGNFWKLMVRIRTEAIQHITWGSAYLDSGVARLPTITQSGMTHQVGLEYNGTKGKWVCLAADVLGY